MKFKYIVCAAAVLFLGGKALGARANTPAPDASRQQLEAQIYFFKEALDLFAPQTPEEAVRLWIKGDETRNGVYKYAASDSRVKQWLVDRWGKPEKSFWIIGGSSPWLAGYDIEEIKNMEPKAIQYAVTYYWNTSAGPEEPTMEHITVTKYKDGWHISKVNPVSGPQNY